MINRPFLSCPMPLLLSDTQFKTTDMKIDFYSHTPLTHFP